jgi:hypothetical protein
MGVPELTKKIREHTIACMHAVVNLPEFASINPENEAKSKSSSKI